jgi:hypothetical protein
VRFVNVTDDSNSPTLSGAQASSTQGNSAKSDLRHYEMYRSSSIVKQWTEREGTTLSTEEDCRMAMVWIALLGGGDYAPEGLAGFGKLRFPLSRLADVQVPPSPTPSPTPVWPTFSVVTRSVTQSTRLISPKSTLR